ncbi:hypothetical protein ACHHYP_01901 [Achlya hypogyna]|uniref:Uncharacterized protein n=1 Tax=Achlya hypogyna TaxID=1202772 RepID=A0A1V9Z7S4_ACHHY|nr:hypothetical protein ACHHYP_01901 [Achlya hypogyna]
MDVQEMLGMVQVNHQAALDAMAAQVEILRETVKLQQEELELQRVAHEKALAALEQDAATLSQQLQQAQAENHELSATVHLLNDELNAKSTAQRSTVPEEPPSYQEPASYEPPPYEPPASSPTSLDTSMDFSYPHWDQSQEPLQMYNVFPTDRPPRAYKRSVAHEADSRLDRELRRLREKLGACSSGL